MDKEEKKRTLRQNSSLHQYCFEVARECQNAGITVEALVAKIHADVTPELIKDMWRAYAKVKYGKKHTSELTTKEVTEIYEEMNRHLSGFGIHISFPSWSDISRNK